VLIYKRSKADSYVKIVRNRTFFNIWGRNEKDGVYLNATDYQYFFALETEKQDIIGIFNEEKSSVAE